MMSMFSRLELLLLIFSPPVLAQTTERISVSTTGAQGDGPSQAPSISADGRYVAFHSVATNLVPGDTNGAGDVFIRDRLSATTERVSLGVGGVEANGQSYVPSLSGDARFVAFESAATNLLGGQLSGWHLYVRDRLSGVNEQIDVDSKGQTLVGNSGKSSISGNGRFVAFFNSYAGQNAACVRDRVSHTTRLVAVCNSAYGLAGGPHVSDDGRHLAFNDCVSATLADFQTLQFWYPSQGASAGHSSATMGLSGDGRIMAMVGYPDWLAGDNNGFHDIFVFDRLGAYTARMSVASDGSQANGHSDLASISRNGRYVTFTSDATNLVAMDTNANTDIFLHDRETHVTTRASVSSNGMQGNDYAYGSCVSDDGRLVAFRSRSSNLTPNDTNGVDDIFVHDFGFDPPSAYCTAKVNSQGCLPAIAWTGTPSLTGPDDFHVTATLVRNGSPGILFWGTSPDAIPFAGGTRCVHAPVIRTPVQNSGGTPYPGRDCSGHYSFHFSHSYSASYFLGAGSTVCTQFWQRDPPHPDGTGQGLTDGLQFTITP